MIFLESCDSVKKFDYCNGIVHSVKKGDTLYTLSRQYDIPLALLLRANPYVDIYNMQVGDEICIPFDFLTTPGTTPTPPVPMPMPTPTVPMPITPVPSKPAPSPCQNTIYYVVKENDTLASVLDYFALELNDLLNCNSMNDIKLLPGTKLQITLKEETEEETE